ncbi:MAG: histidinol-phosphate transaminase, partial [Myxococcaceae bacterium]
ALALLSPDVLARYPEPFADTLKRRIAARLGVDPGCIALGCGSDELLEASFRLLVGPGRTLTWAEPTFSMVAPFARGAGLVTSPVTLTSEGSVDADSLLGAAADAIYLCSPNNPTGGAIPDEVVRKLLESSRGPVFLDEAYVDFSDTASWASRAPDLERLIVFRTFSKAWGLAGLRVGFAVAAPPLIRRLEAARGPYTVNAVAARVLLEVLEEGDGWITARASEAQAARTRLDVALRRLGLTPMRSDANFLFVPTPRAAQLAAGLLERGIRVRAFEGLPVFGDALRITVGPWPIMERLVSALAEVVS